MRDKIYFNNLLDFYEALLTDKQRNICDLYYRHDLSLQEIAENEGISRAAIHDTIKRSSEEMLNYENKLHLFDNNERRNDLYDQMINIADEDMLYLIKKCLKIDKGGKL